MGTPRGPIVFAKHVFLWAGIYGIVCLVPLYALEDSVGRWLPPAPNHPEQFYGFLGVALAWQLSFLFISSDVVRYHVLMLPAIAEKLLFAVPLFALYAQGRVSALLVGPAAIDLVLACLFGFALVRLLAALPQPERKAPK